jgi:hypothetical protein
MSQGSSFIVPLSEQTFLWYSPELFCNYMSYRVLAASVADPCHFEVDPDPDPRIHASD